MGSKKKHKKENIHYPDINLFECKFLGKGHNGAVYLLPDNKVIKICFVMKDFHGEAFILKKVNGNKYFPRIYEVGGNYMIRDYIDGMSLKDYIKRNGLSKKIVLELLALLKEFEKLKFKKIDVRCKDVFVEPGGKLKVIDPQKFFTKERNFPQHLSKGLYKLGVLNTFMTILKEENPKLYKSWAHRIEKYIEEKKLEEEE